MISEVYIRRTEALQEDFFARHADVVAKDLLGKTLVRERQNAATLYAIISEVASFEGSQEDSMTEGALYAPGTLVVSTKHGKKMLDIATYQICKPSCVTLISAVIGDQRGVREVVEGPGNLTKVLEIDKDSFHGLPIRLSPIWIGGQAVEEDRIVKRNKSNVPRNCKGYFYFK